MIFKLPRSHGAGEVERRDMLTVPLLPLRDIVIFPHMVVRHFLPMSQFFQVEAEEVPESWEITPETEALRRAVTAAFETYAKLNKKVPQEALQTVTALEDPGRLADIVSGR